MGALSLYHWDYDRRRPDAGSPFLTYSIAIFQWQPKASGKGLKKVNASRVCGYTADPQSMYAKAQAICDRLNSERASVATRPEWLQKEYSVPRPTWLVVSHNQTDLPGSVVRSIRLDVMRRVLLPAGFVQGRRGTYVRRRADQIHLINFQASKRGHEYTVNLGFHYEFMRPFFARKRLAVRDYDLLDCAFDARIGDFLAGRDKWFEYGTDRAKLAKILEQNAAKSMEVLDRYSRKWADPARWLTKRRSAPWRMREPELFRNELVRHVRRLKPARRK